MSFLQSLHALAHPTAASFGRVLQRLADWLQGTHAATGQLAVALQTEQATCARLEAELKTAQAELARQKQEWLEAEASYERFRKMVVTFLLARQNWRFHQHATKRFIEIVRAAMFIADEEIDAPRGKPQEALRTLDWFLRMLHDCHNAALTGKTGQTL